MPPALGINSENAAHRIAVTWEDGAGVHDGVYIPRRDTSSWINRVAGGRIFPGEHNPATFDVRERGDHIHFRMESRDRLIKVELSASVSSDIPSDSCFHSIEEASSFFEGGSIGYSVTADKRRLDGIRLRTEDWKVQPLAVEKVYSSYFADASLFPEGSTSPKSNAKPEIWERWGEFESSAKNMTIWSERLRDAAKAKDEKAVADIMKDYGRVACGSCHTPFRVPPAQR